ncbi:MAG: thioredoxin family protein [Acidiferrobacterales bacterium]
MTEKRTVEIFVAGCPLCRKTVDLVKRIACPSCAVDVLNMNDPNVASRAIGLGIQSVPAVVIDGMLAEGCAGRGVDEATLRAASVGQPIT